MIYVRCADQEGVVKLDADETRLVSGSLSNEQWVLERINRLRIPKDVVPAVHATQTNSNPPNG